MADEDKKIKDEKEPATDDAKAAAKEGEGETEGEGEEQAAKSKKGVSPLILVISAVASLVVFVGVFSYMMGVFDEKPPESAATESAEHSETGPDDEEYIVPGAYHSDFGRAVAASEAVGDSGVIDTAAQISELDRRQKEVLAEETRIAAERRDLMTLKQEVERLLSKKDGIAEEKVIYMAKLLDNMKADQMASLVAELDNKMILKVLPKMKAQTASKLLAQLPPKRAADLTTALLQSEP